jgi:hypothetical protein
LKESFHSDIPGVLKTSFTSYSRISITGHSPTLPSLPGVDQRMRGLKLRDKKKFGKYQTFVQKFKSNGRG